MICPKGALFLEFSSEAPGGRGVYYARVPAEHTIEDVLNPAYFGNAHQDKGVREGDIIDIEPESALWRIQVRVMAIMPAINHVELRESEILRQDYSIAPPPGFSFKWEGAQAKWGIYKGNTLVDGGFSSQSGAFARAQEMIREKAA